MQVVVRLDPERFNSETLAQMMQDATARRHPAAVLAWDELDEGARELKIDIAQSVIKDMVTLGIIE